MSQTTPDDPISRALAEDLGPGDVTSEFFVDEGSISRALIMVKESAVLAGVQTAADVFRRIDPSLTIEVLHEDGTRLQPGDSVLDITGRTRAILSSERVALNFIQRLSGIATLTRRFVDAVEGTDVRILDTRKTTPGLRALEKAAVRAGGGFNHRFGLYDMAMVKDNHLLASGDIPSLQDAIRKLHAAHPGMPVELEADTLEQVRAFLTLDCVNTILLDNMTEARMREAVVLGRGRVRFEASGGVTLDTVAAIARTGVDSISIGALTHSAPSVDFSLELID